MRNLSGLAIALMGAGIAAAHSAPAPYPAADGRSPSGRYPKPPEPQSLPALEFEPKSPNHKKGKGQARKQRNRERLKAQREGRR